MSRHAVLRLTAFAVVLFLAACGGGGGSGGGTGSTPGKVAVTNGSASGYAAPGDTVHIFAAPAPGGTVFDHWSGDTAGLGDARSWHTTFRLGSKDRHLDAVYTTAPDWSPTTTRINGEDFWYHVPAGAAGLVLFLHGANGDGPQWFTDPEFATFLRATVAHGYGVAALTASDHLGKDWRMEPVSLANPDVRNVVDGWNTLLSSGLVGAGAPLFVVGLSNGGRFSMRLCSLVACTAQATVASQGDTPAFMATVTTPTRFNMLERDTQDLVDAGAAKRFSDQLIVRGVPSEFELFGPSPVYPERFARIPGISVADSRLIHDALQAAGFLDARDFLVDDPYLNASGWHKAIPAPFDSGDTLFYVAEQLYGAWSAHGFYGEHFPRTMRFFDAARAAR